MNPLAAARALAAWWPAQAMRSPESGLSVCVETTRYVTEAFRLAGVTDVRPLPCTLRAYNRPATLALLEGTDPPASACRVEVSPEALAKSKTAGVKIHLVVSHPTFLLDLVLPGLIQAVKAPGFEGVAALAAEKHTEARFVDGAWTVVTENGLLFRYGPRTRYAAWRNTDAWRGDPEPGVLELLADAIQGSDREDTEGALDV